jgi:hypothetical protein
MIINIDINRKAKMTKKDKTKVNISLTIDECYGILTVINKHRAMSETITYGQNDELETSAYELNLKFNGIIVSTEDKRRRRKMEDVSQL